MIDELDYRSDSFGSEIYRYAKAEEIEERLEDPNDELSRERLEDPNDELSQERKPQSVIEIL